MKEEGKSFHLVGSILISVGLREGDKSCPRLSQVEKKMAGVEGVKGQANGVATHRSSTAAFIGGPQMTPAPWFDTFSIIKGFFLFFCFSHIFCGQVTWFKNTHIPSFYQLKRSPVLLLKAFLIVQSHAKRFQMQRGLRNCGDPAGLNKTTRIARLHKKLRGVAEKEPYPWKIEWEAKLDYSPT